MFWFYCPWEPIPLGSGLGCKDPSASSSARWGTGALVGHVGTRVPRLPTVSDQDLQGAWMLSRAGPYPSAEDPWLGAALEGTTLCCRARARAEGGGRGCESW